MITAALPAVAQELVELFGPSPWGDDRPDPAGLVWSMAASLSALFAFSRAELATAQSVSAPGAPGSPTKAEQGWPAHRPKSARGPSPGPLPGAGRWKR